jgi:ornithine cyclodeaminase/alanine dehydrogenase-like protein (mu-crystallin family)
MIVITESQVVRTATFEKWVDSMETAIIAVASGSVIMPKRSHLDFGDKSLLMMPCLGPDYFTVKLITFFPENKLSGEPPINGTVLLNDAMTGKPLAVIDGSSLTAMRTAAVGSLGMRYLSPSASTNLGIIGLGVQGYHQALFACSLRPIKKVSIYDVHKDVMTRFRNDLSKIFPDIEIGMTSDTAELCRNSEIIITATDSAIPVLPDDTSLLTGKTFIAIGSYKPEMRELPDALFNLVDFVFIDTEHALSESGDLIDPLKNGLLTGNRIIPISELVAGKTLPHTPTRLFKSVGMAAFDLYAAILVYQSNQSFDVLP